MSKKVFITGASSGIGEYVAYAFAKRKANLGLVARRADQLNKVAEKCQQLGGTTMVYALDVSDADKCKKAAQEFIAEYGGIDIVFANAGISGIDGLGSGDSATIRCGCFFGSWVSRACRTRWLLRIQSCCTDYGQWMEVFV
jgi:NADP-dependent 3-hydroxy acid dehydrogenase YdfG